LEFLLETLLFQRLADLRGGDAALGGDGGDDVAERGLAAALVAVRLRTISRAATPAACGAAITTTNGGSRNER
jgi:hypothetical protein